ncbi:ATP-dependent RNA helicase VC1407 [Vibrio sp. JCM 19053]|nr:ATP-dependent RNA helicase VC1407 [Vibrio sp. JCM 19053]
MPFSKLGLSASIADAVKALGYEKPTSIQQKAIPIVLRGRNLIAAAQTGTGKTASFVLPILEKLSRGETQRKKTRSGDYPNANTRTCASGSSKY